MKKVIIHVSTMKTTVVVEKTTMHWPNEDIRKERPGIELTTYDVRDSFKALCPPKLRKLLTFSIDECAEIFDGGPLSIVVTIGIDENESPEIAAQLDSLVSSFKKHFSDAARAISDSLIIGNGDPGEVDFVVSAPKIDSNFDDNETIDKPTQVTRYELSPGDKRQDKKTVHVSPDSKKIVDRLLRNPRKRARINTVTFGDGDTIKVHIPPTQKSKMEAETATIESVIISIRTESIYDIDIKGEKHQLVLVPHQNVDADSLEVFRAIIVFSRFLNTPLQLTVFPVVTKTNGQKVIDHYILKKIDNMDDVMSHFDKNIPTFMKTLR